MDQFMETYMSSQDSHTFQDPITPELSDDCNECIILARLKEVAGHVHITDLPPEIMQHILRNLSFDNISKIRVVSRYFNGVCSSLLNSEFSHLRTVMLQKFHAIKAMMPRRESARRKHPLARKSDIIETLHMRLSLLQMTFGKHIERKYCCFFPGEIIDEIYRILHYIKTAPSLNRAYKVTDELFDLSTMAMEYFKEHIEPFLPEISYLAHDILEHSPFISPRSDLVIQKAQLMQMECTNMRNEASQSKNDCVSKFQQQLKSTRDLAKRNRRDVLKIKKSLKSARKRVNTAVKELQQMKWQQKNCNVNDILLEIKRHKYDYLKCACFSSNKLIVTEHLSKKKNF